MPPARSTLAIALTLAACAPRPEPPPRCAWDTAGRTALPPEHLYRVSAGPGAEELCVEVDLPGRASGRRTWTVAPKLRPYVRDVAIGDFDEVFVPARVVDGGWEPADCSTSRVCRLRYRILLGEAARAFEDLDLALPYRGAILAPPSSWMMRPLHQDGAYRLAVTVPPGFSFVSGLPRAPGNPGLRRGELAALADTPYAAFGPLDVVTEQVPGAALDVAITEGPLAVSRPALRAWILASARAVAAYYGRFPIHQAAILVLVSRSDRIADGHTMGNGGGAVVLSVGQRAPAKALADDWILVHELVHLSFPNVERPWAEEGLATYLEPLIRAHAGLLDPDEVWRSMILGLPEGQPGPGDGGLDRTDTWGRRYWGGAMFWFQADLEIRKRTAGQRSLDDALRAIAAAGGNVAVNWTLERALEIGDRATGTDVLATQLGRMAHAPIATDLPALWKSLGVSLAERRVVYDDAAPLAGVRRSLVEIRR